eukprot:scaffold22545_cov72-Phaeocystis_antarctica.AAC.3
MSEWSIETDPSSFSMTTMRLPWSAVSTRLTSVVLPLPRKPVTIVIGTCRAPGSAFVQSESDFSSMRCSRLRCRQASRSCVSTRLTTTTTTTVSTAENRSSIAPKGASRRPAKLAGGTTEPKLLVLNSPFNGLIRLRSGHRRHSRGCDESEPALLGLWHSGGTGCYVQVLPEMSGTQDHLRLLLLGRLLRGQLEAAQEVAQAARAGGQAQRRQRLQGLQRGGEAQHAGGRRPVLRTD